MKQGVVLLVLALGGCGDSGQGGAGGEAGSPATGGANGDGGGGSAATSNGGAGGEALDPIATFYDDFGASRYSRASTDAALLDAVMDADPSAGDAAIIRSLAHLWHISEFGRDTTQDPSTILPEAVAMLTQFQQALDNNPDDPRVPCWLGLTQVSSGRYLNNQTMVDQGFATIEDGVAAFPEFNLFCRALAYAPLPASDPDFQLAVDALFENMDVCFGESVDRDNPDVTPYLTQATAEGPKRACWNSPLARHNAEGFYLFFGDLLVKAGRIQPALVSYQNATLIAEYASWPYQELIDERFAADLPARAALYADADVMNDPPLGGDSAFRGCTACHASSADE